VDVLDEKQSSAWFHEKACSPAGRIGSVCRGACSPAAASATAPTLPAIGERFAVDQMRCERLVGLTPLLRSAVIGQAPAA